MKDISHIANLPMKEKIRAFSDLFPHLTKDYADLIENVIEWDDDLKAAYIVAKRHFEGSWENES
jgi:hypothetical protein